MTWSNFQILVIDSMKDVKTLVYFDLEATGLKSSGKPRITELSLVAVNIEDVLDLQEKLVDNCKQNKKLNVSSLVPRVLNKLTLCVYPMAPILPVVTNITGLDNCQGVAGGAGYTNITGLDNYNLTDQAKLDSNTLDLLNSFLARLPPPVCLVAHNGDQYDFPLLKAELARVGGGLGAHILCVDSYVGIRDIFNRKHEAEKGEVTNSITNSSSGQLDSEMLFCQGVAGVATYNIQNLSISKCAAHKMPCES